MLTTIYSLLHMLVDGICAFSMLAKFSVGKYESFLIYNFCAFALQMPFGALMDGISMSGEKQKKAYICAILGVSLTFIGALTHPAILGCGNALFHVGGGMGVIEEDYNKNRKGQLLGIFVAPGALGLFLGGQLAIGYTTAMERVFLIVLGVVSVLLLVILGRNKRSISESVILQETAKGSVGLLLICSFLVVVLRSYVGMAISFPWKTTFFISLLSVLAVVGGKMAGGFFAARIGVRKSMIISLVFAACCYGFCDFAFFGIVALFLFNMTMPITLYMLVDKLRKNPGFSFGVLTFGLFLGFLPTYYGIKNPMSGPWLGICGSIISLVLLLLAARKRKVGEKQNVLS